MKKAEKGYRIEDYDARGPVAKYPWRTMDVGESFLLDPTNSPQSHVGDANIRYAPRRFSQRTTPEGVHADRFCWTCDGLSLLPSVLAIAGLMLLAVLA